MSGTGESASESRKAAEGQPQQHVDEIEPKEVEDGPCTVLVTGASGYIATHIIQQLLKQERFKVRGTVRDLTNESKVQSLKQLVPDPKYPLELVQASLEEPGGWVDAVKGCSYVLHVASPFPAKIPRDENTLIQPAVEGTLNVLRACAEVGGIKRVVLTSSIAAISSGMNGNDDPQQVYTELDWSLEQNCTAYEKSKLRAEQAAWKFVNSLEENKRFELAVVNPAVVFGPLLSTNGGVTSVQPILQLFTKPFGVPNVNWPMVDVRDVAAAHIAAIEKPEAAGARSILVTDCVWYSKIADIVFKEFFPFGYRTSTMSIPDFAMWFARWFDDGAKWLYPALGKHLQFNTDRMRNVLGIQPYSVHETITDTCYSLIELGLVKATNQYKEHRLKPAAPKEPQGEEEPKMKEEPKMEEGKKEEPKMEEAKKEEPKMEEGKKEEPKKEEVKKEEPKEEEPKTEEVKKEEPKVEEAKKEEPKEEEPKTEEVKKEEPKMEEVKKEEPKMEEGKKDESKEEPGVQEEKKEATEAVTQRSTTQLQ